MNRRTHPLSQKTRASDENEDDVADIFGDFDDNDDDDPQPVIDALTDAGVDGTQARQKARGMTHPSDGKNNGALWPWRYSA